MQLGYVHAHRILKANHAVKYVKPMVCVMYLTIPSFSVPRSPIPRSPIPGFKDSRFQSISRFSTEKTIFLPVFNLQTLKTSLLLVFYSYVLVFYSYVTRVYSCVTRMYSYVLVCYSYVTRMYSCGVLVTIM